MSAHPYLASAAVVVLILLVAAILADIIDFGE